ncbi:acyl-CoA synthetase [Saccharomonospora sp. CUA-673]|uniref:long-chain-fatty-acid--CoA ligase n=1 Tax=Saccharomonospora sp. CUA-673 TaxID=1904969 RepID=UPI000967A442|nr:long-chain-fatty-acid--CoA ligase [Saccharomonospora sp. CUA-673]OLT48581.1 acyl-CoA synthetase [Saccharomonospora sp. CUA-673]
MTGAATTPVPTVTELLTAQLGRTAPGLRFGDAERSWDEVVRASAVHGAAARALLDRCRHTGRAGPGPAHVGVLADNGPEFAFLLGGAALSGSVLVGLNPTRRGTALARDVRTADCGVVLAQPSYRHLLGDVDVPVVDLDGPEWTDLLAEHARAVPDPVPTTPDDLLMLIFTSGTSGDPKAVRCTHGKIAFPGRMLAERFGLSTSDTVYVAMPMFHSNAIMAGWAVGLAAGAAVALAPRFSASGFLPDVRRFGATYANYVGTPLSYVLATPDRPDDADNPLRIVYGNEGAEEDLAAFARRFGCHVVDAFGSTEGGVGFARTPDTPAGSLGRLTDDVRILHPDTGLPCPPAEFAQDGSVCNAAEAVGELVNVSGAGWFAGYYNDPDSDAERLRGGRYHTGDLAYADADGYVYFAGRTADWVRVDGENLGTAPIERILTRHPDVAEAAVYAVRARVGDEVMAALVPAADAQLDPAEFSAFLARQDDLGPKQRPRHIRITRSLPRTATFKVVKRALAAEGSDCADPVWRADGHDADANAAGTYRPVMPGER